MCVLVVVAVVVDVAFAVVVVFTWSRNSGLAFEAASGFVPLFILVVPLILSSTTTRWGIVSRLCLRFC